jgi:drug/metabolite transporter (DMT)-like permease
MSTPRLARGPVYALIAAVAFGAVALFAKVIYAAGGTAVFYILLRAAAGVVVIGAVMLARRGRLTLMREQPVAMAVYAAGILGIAFGYMGAIAFIPASLAVLFFYLFPMLTVAAVALRDRAWPRPLDAASALGAFAGLFLILGGQTADLAWQGVALGLLAAVGATAALLMSPVLLRHGDAVEISFTASVAILIPAALIGLAVGEITPPQGAAALGVLAVAALLYGVGLVCQVQAVHDTAIQKIGVVFNVEPVFVIVVATAALGEALSARQWLGAAVVVVAALVIGWPRRPRVIIQE